MLMRHVRNWRSQEARMADGDGSLNEKDRIGIMLEEYKALRAEIVARTTMQAQLSAAFGAGAITVFGLMFAYHYYWIGSIMIGLLLVVLYLVSDFLNEDTHNIGKRLLEIENEINRRAGETLFSWESRFGIGQLGSYTSRVMTTVKRLFRAGTA
jgi:hypothetical protein